MTAIDHDELNEVMRLLATTEAAVLAFVDVYRDRLRAVVRDHLRRLDRPDLASDAAEVDGLIWDVALFLQARAAAWQPGGALPWTWAERGIRHVIATAIGHARADVDVDELDGEDRASQVGTDGDDIELEDLIDRPIVALLVRALDVVGCSDRDRRVHVEYRRQCAAGDPSPATTVGWQFGLRADHVRQIDRRVRAKLAALASGDDEFAPLAELPWVTGSRGPQRGARIADEVAA
jgi:hypothetical protein